MDETAYSKLSGTLLLSIAGTISACAELIIKKSLETQVSPCLSTKNRSFSTMSIHSCNRKSAVISHIYTLFECCLFNFSAFRSVVLEFWWKNRKVRSFLSRVMKSNKFCLNAYRITECGRIAVILISFCREFHALSVGIFLLLIRCTVLDKTCPKVEVEKS